MFNERFGLETDTLNGTKDMTRRLIPQKVLDTVPAYQEEYLAGALEPISIEDAIMNMCGPEKIFKVGYEIGEIVAVAQSYRKVFGYGDSYHYGLFGNTAAWDNKMYVRAELMPRRIKITGKKVERLQAISDEDCLREGIREHLKGVQYGFHSNIGYCGQYPFDTPRAAFAALINKISKKDTWNSNPYVFAYTYELVK